MKHPLYPLLLRSLEETLSPAEARQLTQALAESAELRQEETRLQKTRELLKAQDFRFAPFFAAKVLRNLHPDQVRENDRLHDFLFAFRRVSLPALALMLALLVGTYLSEQTLSLDALTGVADLTVDDLVTEVFTQF
jgi:anti-sigma factor RsiW